jgi:divalent metal cation (Fe/Co/Zn/Cd) transporter
MSDTCKETCCHCSPTRPTAGVLWLQSITIGWMLVECAVALYSARVAHSSAMLAFGADSLVELLSACVVLAQYSPRFPLSRIIAARFAAVLLIVLAVVVCATAVLSLSGHVEPRPTALGMSITIAALVVMPVLARAKRRLSRETADAALAADAAQSGMCAWLATVALLGVGLNSLWQITWADSAAALVAIPMLLVEARNAWRGEVCAC